MWAYNAITHELDREPCPLVASTTQPSASLQHSWLLQARVVAPRATTMTSAENFQDALKE